MPNSEQLRELARQHGNHLVEAALRDSLREHAGLDHDAVLQAMLHGAERPVDFAGLQRRLEELAKVGKPQPPGEARNGANAVPTARIGIQGNPAGMDEGYQSGWHFKQANGWDAWVNLAARPAGGFFVNQPAMRRTGDQGAARLGSETTANFDGNMNLVFTIDWGGGTRGGYECGIDLGAKEIQGRTWDENNAGVLVDFVGTQMPLTADRPGIPVAQPGVARVRQLPILGLNVVPNMQENGFTVNAIAAGFIPGEAVTLQGKAVSGATHWDWSEYANGVADAFGRVTFPPFGVIRPAGVSYTFRAIGGASGYTPEVGF